MNTLPTQKIFKRRIRLIYPQFQLILVGVNIVTTMCILGIVLALEMRSLERLRSIGYSIGLAQDHPYFKFIDFQADSLLPYLVVAFAGGIIVSSIITLVLSHHLAGPIVRVSDYFKEIAQTGKITTGLSFRNRDFFSDLPSVINEALSVLSNKKEK